jgi:ribosome biogenesis protein ENP2
LILAACEAPEMCAYYVPEIGPAPRWAGFLDNVTEEMAEDMSAAGKGAYSDFKFVDKQELDT